MPEFLGFSGGSAGKESACNPGDSGSIYGLGRSTGEGIGYPLQYSGLENSMNYSPWGPKESDSTEWLSLCKSRGSFFEVQGNQSQGSSLPSPTGADLTQETGTQFNHGTLKTKPAYPMPNVNMTTFLHFLLFFSSEAQGGLSEIPFQSKGYSLCIIWACVVHYWATLNIHWKDWCWSWSFNTLATWGGELSHWKRPGCWERLMARGEGGSRGWESWIASPTQWTWIWANSGT